MNPNKANINKVLPNLHYISNINKDIQKWKVSMTSEGLGDFADPHARKFTLMSMGGQTEGLVCADPVAWEEFSYIVSNKVASASENSLSICPYQ